MRRQSNFLVILFFILNITLCACGKQNQEGTNLSMAQAESEVDSYDSGYDERNEDNSAVEIQDLDLETILADPELTNQYFDAADITDFDEETILNHDKLLKMYRDSQEFEPSKVDMKPSPDSSCFNAVGYSQIWNNLVVSFRDSGVKYVYYGVPENEWNKFISADSLGKHYNSYIKGFYEYDRLD